MDAGRTYLDLVRRILSFTGVLVLLVAMNLLILASSHHHHLKSSLQVTSTHHCLLCQVSPSVDVAEELLQVGDPPEVVHSLPGLSESIHTELVTTSFRSRAPPTS